MKSIKFNLVYKALCRDPLLRMKLMSYGLPTGSAQRRCPCNGYGGSGKENISLVSLGPCARQEGSGLCQWKDLISNGPILLLQQRR